MGMGYSFKVRSTLYSKLGTEEASDCDCDSTASGDGVCSQCGMAGAATLGGYTLSQAN